MMHACTRICLLSIEAALWSKSSLLKKKKLKYIYNTKK